ncbi:MAG TPA: hypothetical protein VN200_08300 [Rhodoglobus sp.]|nr:hypothetical protein [Rhodoglobus sp.]
MRSCAHVPRGLDDASGWLREQEAFWLARIDALTAYLEENTP